MRNDAIPLPGLGGPASITVDRWGIPHIEAGNLMDLFLAQGFNAARDRLWQIDLWRKRGLGLLAADFGPGYLEQDRAARLFLYRGDMQAEWDSYSPDAKAICEAFVKGINAYVDLARADPSFMPPEFAITDTSPGKWRAEDVVRIRSHSWTRNALSEIVRARVIAKSSPDVDLLRQSLNPPKMPDRHPNIDLASIPTEVLDVFKLGLIPVTFSEERLRAKVEDSKSWTQLSPLGDVVRASTGQGSNNWVIAGNRTETGRPILANDPHRAHGAPSLRYIVHLSCPEFNGIGAGEPILPGISIGHNGTIAFGLTLFSGPDEEDIYVYETSSSDPERYHYDDGWEQMSLVAETVVVRGAGEKSHVLKFTRHGPVIYEDHANRRAYALRSVWFEPGAAPYFVSISSMRAKDYVQFANDMKRWVVPAVNQVYADTSGSIAWITAGYSPIRRNWDGLLPVPGDGRFEWAGYYRAGELPHILNPTSGYVATANEMNVPTGWSPSAGEIGYEWVDFARAHRIGEVLEQTISHTVDSSCALQTDVLSLPARRILRLLADMRSATPELDAALTMLAGWDAKLATGSAPAALFEVWWSKHLRPAILAGASADPEVLALLGIGDPDTILERLEDIDEWSQQPTGKRDALLVDTLRTAWFECAELMGPNTQDWAWGRLHHGYFQHALSPLRKLNGRNYDVGPLPVGGSESTPMNSTYRLTDFRVTLGASFRMVVDVGDWDKSVCINVPGQSGNPRSPHYSDLATKWADGKYVPMLYSKQAIAAAAELRIELIPDRTL